jgi:hypothetical protein
MSAHSVSDLIRKKRKIGRERREGVKVFEVGHNIVHGRVHVKMRWVRVHDMLTSRIITGKATGSNTWLNRFCFEFV